MLERLFYNNLNMIFENGDRFLKQFDTANKEELASLAPISPEEVRTAIKK